MSLLLTWMHLLSVWRHKCIIKNNKNLHSVWRHYAFTFSLTPLEEAAFKANRSVIVRYTEPWGFSNDFIGVTAGHTFFDNVITALPRSKGWYIFPYASTMFSTGMGCMDPQNCNLLLFLYFLLFVYSIKVFTNRKYAFFSTNLVRLSPDNRNPNLMDYNWPCTVINNRDWLLRNCPYQGVNTLGWGRG